MTIELSLGGLDFNIPTKSDHNWSELTNWIIQANEILNETSSSFDIPISQANLTPGGTVNLYTVDTPTDDRHIIFNYGIYRNTTGGGATSRSETGIVMFAYNPTNGSWELTNTSTGDAGVTFSVSGGNIIQATTSTLTGSEVLSVIQFRGTVIRIS